MPTDPILFSNAHQRGTRRKVESSVWRRGSTEQRAKGTPDCFESPSSSSSSSSSKSPVVERRSSYGMQFSIKSSSISSKGLSTSTNNVSNFELELKEQINENLLLTQEIMDLKMRLATALAMVDAEKHTNRLQSEQIANLCDDNEDLKNELDEAHLQIIDMAQTKGVLTPSTCTSTPADDKREGWLRRVSSSMGLTQSTSSSTLQSSRRSSIGSTSLQLQKSMSRLTSFTADLAEEEVSEAEKKTSFHSSLSSLPEGRHSRSMADQKNDDWLDLDTVVLDSDRLEHHIFTARRA